eukprot:SAG31_NODE_33489_length_343_cov_0.836066_1_plen_42_part_10
MEEEQQQLQLDWRMLSAVAATRSRSVTRAAVAAAPVGTLRCT